MKRNPSRHLNIIAWIAQIVAAVIFAQTLFFKFSGADESIFIFDTLGVEPWGRIATGFLELASALLLLHPKTHWFGAAQGLAIILGAIGAHLTVLGIEIQGDGGLLFSLALVVATSCGISLYLRRGTWLPIARAIWSKLNSRTSTLSVE